MDRHASRCMGLDRPEDRTRISASTFVLFTPLCGCWSCRSVGIIPVEVDIPYQEESTRGELVIFTIGTYLRKEVGLNRS